MAIKRLNLSELEEKCIDIFYDYMVCSNTFYNEGVEQECDEHYPHPVDQLYHDQEEILKENLDRQKLYTEEISHRRESNDNTVADILQEQLNYLIEEEGILKSMNISSQKQRYKKTKKTEYTRSVIRIPLSKKINGYYDEFFLDVLFYDDVCTLNGKYNDYKKLKTDEDRKEFLKNNTEITHLALVLLKSNKEEMASIIIRGKHNVKDSRVVNGQVLLLGSKFADLSTLRLSDLDEIRNNDARQKLQELIDLDKENMTLKADKNIRGSNYRLLEYSSNGNINYYIRYVCSSTGRVYYNPLIVDNLALSSYFKKNNLESYLDSWWNITHLGASVEGKSVIDC